jgi:glutamyl-tRNA synthetase
MKMKNSLTLGKEEVQQLLDTNTPYVIRISMPVNETIAFTDMIRGEIKNDSNLVDDKVLLKADGMPTYHLAVVVDDYLMKISHAFRGEEWLPSAPVHILLWKYLDWEQDMPHWAHLPLILKPVLLIPISPIFARSYIAMDSKGLKRFGVLGFRFWTQNK